MAAPMLWVIKLLILSSNIRASFKALKLRKKRVNAAPQDVDTKNQLSSADRARRRAVKEQLTAWVVFITFVALERAADKTVGYVLPLYAQFKLVGALLLLLGRSVIAPLVFKKVIKPLIKPYERPIDGLGTILGHLLVLTLSLVMFAPRKALKWWQGTKQEPQIPSILANLRKPQRPQLAKDLAKSIENQQAKSTADITNRLAQPVMAPKAVPRRAIATISLPTTQAQRPLASSVRYRPIAQPRAPVKAATSLYPTLTQLRAPTHPIRDVHSPSATSLTTSRTASSTQNGNARGQESAAPTTPKSAASSPRITSVAEAAPSPTDSPVRHSEAPPLAQNESSTQHPMQPPPTPAPPGAFAFSPPPPTIRVLRLAGPDELSRVTASPRQKASSALADLTMELDGPIDLTMSPKRKASNTSDTGLGRASAKRAKRMSAKGSTLAEILETEKRQEGSAAKGGADKGKKIAPTRTRTGKRARVRDLDSDEESDAFVLDSDSDSDDHNDHGARKSDDDFEPPRKAVRTTSAKRTKGKTAAFEASDSEEEEPPARTRVASRQNTLAASTSKRKLGSSTLGRSSITAPPGSRTVSALPVPKSRSGVLSTTATKGTLSVPSSSDEQQSSLPRPQSRLNNGPAQRSLARSTSVSTSIAGTNPTAPKRKARRVALGTTKDLAVEEQEIDGVPVVARRPAARRKM